MNCVCFTESVGECQHQWFCAVASALVLHWLCVQSVRLNRVRLRAAAIAAIFHFLISPFSNLHTDQIKLLKGNNNLIVFSDLDVFHQY